MKYIISFIFCSAMNFLVYSQSPMNTVFSIQSEAFKEIREFKVHLPKKMKTNEHLPVIFIFDAQWNPYYKLLTSTIDYLTEIKEFPRSIIVGIKNKKRQYELTPAPVNEDWKIPSLGGAKFLEKHLTNEVIPFLKTKYNIADFRIGIGHSLGGTFVLNSLTDNPKLFNAYIAISPNLQLDDEEVVLKLQRNITKIKKLNSYFYVTMGTSGNTDIQFLPPVKKLDSVLKFHKSKNLDWNFKILKNYNHATTPLESTHLALQDLSKRWKISPKQREEIINSKNVLQNFMLFYEKLSNWTGYTVIPQKHDYYNFIAALEKNKKHKDIIKLAKNAIENYPTESRYYNIIAENLILINKKATARKYLEQAIKVLEDEYFEYNNDKEYFKKLYAKNLHKLNN
ncbi:alpha/beta hydrolase-fold protein [uncultured Tenacibaculum sp.]|uniref:alpha/beta hydrolase-fold protein n=1 Tax=uncultured Tenacibaculum sp. TaxID=174713 RepID=UPI002615A600|nr:alpha/beta hydrolase-fold protein [uncultured Tenacibaculum sp.]